MKRLYQGPLTLDADRWHVLDRAPNCCAAISSFSAESSAREYIYRRQRIGNGSHLTLIAPTAGAGVLL
jgi:hypothetical protein